MQVGFLIHIKTMQLDDTILIQVRLTELDQFNWTFLVFSEVKKPWLCHETCCRLCHWQPCLMIWKVSSNELCKCSSNVHDIWEPNWLPGPSIFRGACWQNSSSTLRRSRLGLDKCQQSVLRWDRVSPHPQFRFQCQSNRYQQNMAENLFDLFESGCRQIKTMGR